MSSNSLSSISLVFPLFNEQQRFVKNFQIIKRFAKLKPDWEFIFINDGSKDKTEEITVKAIENFPQMRLISYSKNKGKGFAVKKGVMKAEKKYTLFLDIDFSTPLSELEKFAPFVKKKSDIVIGTRKVRGAAITKHQAQLREWAGKQFTDLTNLWLGMDISDYTCGFKLFNTKAAKRLFSAQKIKRWGFDAEILYLANIKKYKIVEVPIVWQNDPLTKVNLIRDIFKTLIELFLIRWYYWLDKYKL